MSTTPSVGCVTCHPGAPKRSNVLAGSRCNFRDCAKVVTSPRTAPQDQSSPKRTPPGCKMW